MNLSFWAKEEAMTLKEYEINFPIYSTWSDTSEFNSDEAYIKFNYIEPAGMGIRLEKVTIIKHENFGDGEIKWSVESEELIWFDKMVLKDNIDYLLGRGEYKLSESKWKEVVIEFKEFIRDII
jgi:hypothetical protein